MKIYIVLKIWVDDPYLEPYESIFRVVKNEEMAKKICEDKNKELYPYEEYIYKEFEVEEVK